MNNNLVMIPAIMKLMDRLFDRSSDGRYIQPCANEAEARIFAEEFRKQYDGWIHVEQRVTNVFLKPIVDSSGEHYDS